MRHWRTARSCARTSCGPLGTSSSPADIRWITLLTGPRVLSGSAHRIRFLELDDARWRAANELIRRALAGGKQLTRQELQAAIEAAASTRRTAPRLHGHRRGDDVPRRERRPTRQKQTYALLDEWAPPTPRDLVRSTGTAPWRI